jgi:hypothetical protein
MTAPQSRSPASATSPIGQSDVEMLKHLADSMGFGRTHDMLRRVIAACPYLATPDVAATPPKPEDFAILREIETEWLIENLSESIANLGYPVGCGISPTYDHLKRAADTLFERYAKMIEMAHGVAQQAPDALAELIAAKASEPAFAEFAKAWPLREVRFLPVIKMSPCAVSDWYVVLPSGKQIILGNEDWEASALSSTDRRSPRYPDAISPEPPENAQ